MMENDDSDERKGLLRDHQVNTKASAPLPPSYQEPAPSYSDITQYQQYQQRPYVNQPVYQTIPVVQTQVILVGGCPACRVGVLEDDYTCCGICCAVLFFPLGVLCCLATKQRRCCNCGAVYG